MLLQTYLSVGRGGEVASSSWTRLKWNFALDNAVNTWGEPKTGTEYPVPRAEAAAATAVAGAEAVTAAAAATATGATAMTAT